MKNNAEEFVEFKSILGDIDDIKKINVEHPFIQKFKAK